MKIEKLQQSSRQPERFFVTLEDGRTLGVTEKELLQFSLYQGMELEPETVAQLERCGKRSGTRAAAARMVGRRALSRQELTRRLLEKGSREEDAAEAADWLEEIGALDDGQYAALLVRHLGSRGYGAPHIRQELARRGVPRALWEQALSQLPPAQEQIQAFVQGKLRSRVPEEKEIKRLAQALRRRGFGWADIRQCLREYEEYLGGEDNE